MIETTLVEYGLLGVMIMLLISAIVYLAKREERRDEKISRVVENNTIAITRFVDQTKRCEVKTRGY